MATFLRCEEEIEQDIILETESDKAMSSDSDSGHKEDSYCRL
jgi:hypothetical protein